jgi:hypothetical protein
VCRGWLFGFIPAESASFSAEEIRYSRKFGRDNALQMPLESEAGFFKIFYLNAA